VAQKADAMLLQVEIRCRSFCAVGPERSIFDTAASAVPRLSLPKGGGGWRKTFKKFAYNLEISS
jgi:hypothetical protein